MNESRVQRAIRLDAESRGILMRNNVGALIDRRGVPVRFGLGNDSKALNSRFKSSDCVGVTSYVISPGDVGRVVGVFTAIEVKAPEWKFTGNGREVAQQKFIDVIRGFGGLAGFANSLEMYHEILRKGPGL